MTPLDRAQVKVLTIRSAILVVLLLFAAMGTAPFVERWAGVSRWLSAGFVLALGIGFLLAFPKRRWRSWGYREAEEEIEIRRGRLIRVRTIIPFARVQHIDVAQGPIQRPFGLATLVLHTAGTQGASVSLPGLAMPVAEAMRDRIRAKIRQDLL